MSEKLYQIVLEHLRAGNDEASLMDCGCMGCPLASFTDVEDACQCKQHCRCKCTLPDVAERNRQAREQMAGYVARAREEISASRGIRAGVCGVGGGECDGRRELARPIEAPAFQPARAWFTQSIYPDQRSGCARPTGRSMQADSAWNERHINPRRIQHRLGLSRDPRQIADAIHRANR